MTGRTLTEKGRLINEVFDVAVDILSGGNLDPTLLELASEHAKRTGALNALADVQYVETAVRAALAAVLNAGVSTHKWFVVPVNPTYYRVFARGTLVSTPAEANRCISGIGRGSGVAGILVIEGTDSLLLKAYLQQGGRVYAGRGEALRIRLEQVVAEGQLTDHGAMTSLPADLKRTKANTSAAIKALTAGV